MVVANGSNDRERQGPLVQPPAGGGPTDTTAAALGGVRGNGAGFTRGATGEQRLDPGCHLGHQCLILPEPLDRGSFPPCRPFAGILGALLLGTLERGELHQDACLS